ncbi:MAG: KEOPS complex subunit Pcc1 [Methanothrix sp.]|jgi:KEOPS complex subunit Pcc1|uniref:KEOPS complex subunit Pcc1 n=1 Tax=Methanothrix sp. TaxID=90426 RepID=UPI00247D5664|nr:KEOPS complex subunit Pcc1 [Methanothrix sp.]
MRGRAEIVFELPDPELVFRALEPELDDELHRGKVAIRAVDNGMVLIVEGDDVVSLRAALNTWLRLVRICVEMVEI